MSAAEAVVAEPAHSILRLKVGNASFPNSTAAGVISLI